MKFEFLANAHTEPPPRPTNPSIGYPSNGDPSTGRPPTIPGAWFFYMLMVEFTGILEAAGIAPSATNLHQLADFFETYRSHMDEKAAEATVGATSASNSKASALESKNLAATYARQAQEYVTVHGDLAFSVSQQDGSVSVTWSGEF